MPDQYSAKSLENDEVLDLPEDLEEKINGKKENDSERDDEPTEVTKLFDEMRECASDTRKSLKKAKQEAERVQQLTRSPSRSKLKKALSTPPPPPSKDSDKK